MRVIIAGGRDFSDYDLLQQFIRSTGWEITQVVCGMAVGADTLGKQYAEEHGIPAAQFPAEWRRNGVFVKSAGYQRNVRMAENADALLAMWDGRSKGTKHMIDIALRKGLPVRVGRY